MNAYISTMDNTIPQKMNLETVKNFWKNYENMDKNLLKHLDCIRFLLLKQLEVIEFGRVF